ncbi:mucin-5AC-like isoform X1 [Homarus americanus]|nr:mucin-5AC-like isoform X1 [Homarus americanus]XP_042213414.1 mucin-5AC-like isoform X1 [Homarus americanus]XP_042213415.1 mucin-5AC-like isoform X1 [Homarus americanus]XP_042213416.1 mucin-5AC-like isoform X1 [Homarus americanus]
MAGAGVQLTLCGLLLYLAELRLAYRITTVDSAGVCNETIWLEDGAKSAAILRLTAKDFYDFAPLRCHITFKASLHLWSGLTGVLEEVDLRRYEGTAGHRPPQTECVDYIMVVSKAKGISQEQQCGSWSVSGQERLTDAVSRRTLFGNCPDSVANGNSVHRCGVMELTVEVSIGERDHRFLGQDIRWRPHRGFTFVVTAYSYPYPERDCAGGLRSCGTTGSHDQKTHCVHQSLWCDHHINCGQPHNLDEISCLDDEILGGLVTVMVGPWVGAALLLLLVLGMVVYWRRARPPAPRDHLPPQELNSYAESYEVSSTLSSAHHMAIQVRVVCNSGHGIHTQLSHPWQTSDLPPSYESLFPQGPPSPKFSTSTSTTTIPATNSATSFDITTTSLVSLGSNTNASPATSTFFSNTTQTSSIVIPISAICNTLSTSGVSTSSYTTTTAFTTTPVFTNTATSTNTTTSATTSSSFTNTTMVTGCSESTTTPTTTLSVASYSSSPSTTTTVSVTSAAISEGPGTVSSQCEAHSADRLTTFHSDNTDFGNRSNRRHVTPTTNHTEVGTRTSKASTAPRPAPPYATPPLVEPEDTEITPSKSVNCTSPPEPTPDHSCPRPGGAESEATVVSAAKDTSEAGHHTSTWDTETHYSTQGSPLSLSFLIEDPSHVVDEVLPPFSGGDTETFEDTVSALSISVDTGQTGTSVDTMSTSVMGGSNSSLSDAREEVLITPIDDIAITAPASCSFTPLTVDVITSTTGPARAPTSATAAAESDS